MVCGNFPLITRMARRTGHYNQRGDANRAQWHFRRRVRLFMDVNPYESPRETTFYTDDITTMPAMIIWGVLRRQSLVLAVLFFPCLLIRKLLRLRYRANHGTCRPSGLYPIADGQIPTTVRDAFASFDGACSAYGMKLVGRFRPAWIGKRPASSPSGSILRGRPTVLLSGFGSGSAPSQARTPFLRATHDWTPMSNCTRHLWIQNTGFQKCFRQTRTF